MSSDLISFISNLFQKLNFIHSNNIVISYDNNEIIIEPYWKIYINHKPYLPFDTILFSIQYNNDTLSIYQNSYSYFNKGENYIKLSHEAWTNRINSNPNWKLFTNKLITLNNITSSNSNENKIIYMYTDEVSILNNMIHILDNSKSKYIILTHTSDYPLDLSYINIINHLNIHRWYGIDCNLNDVERNNKVIPLPIGIGNSMYLNYEPETGYMAEFNKVIYQIETGEIQKTNNIFFNFSIHTNRVAREDCFNKLSNYIEWIPMMPFMPFIHTIATYKFCICPVGNGLDTHRVWDCMYLRIIPIMLRNKYSEYWEHKIPCILLNDWTDLVHIINDMDKMLEFMEHQWTEDNIYKMKYWNFAYYQNMIQNDFQSIS